MPLVKKATSSFPLRLVSPENLLTYADQIAVETDSNGNMTKSQAELNAELAALAAGGGSYEPTGPGFTLALGTQANNISGLTLTDNVLSVNTGDGLAIDSATGKVGLNLGTGLAVDEKGTVFLKLAEGFELDEEGALKPPANSGFPADAASIIIQ